MLEVGAPGDLAGIQEKVCAGERLSFEDGLKLFESNNVTEMGRLANHVREHLHGDKAYFSHKYRLYPTNICMYRCRFCAFRVSKGDERGYEWPAEKTLHELSRVDLTGVTEFHIVGGVHPDWGFDVYLDIIRELHRAYPDIHIKAWTAVEIDAFTHLSGKSVRHDLGMKTNSTMLYGHIETPESKVDHMLRLRDLQDRTGGFRTFIPLAFHPDNTRLKHLPRATGAEDLKHIAIGRLLLDNVPHIMAYWVTETPEVAQLGLSFGADDLDGTIMVDEEIINAAGGNHVEGAMTKDRFAAMIREAGRVPLERDTEFNMIREYQEIPL